MGSLVDHIKRGALVVGVFAVVGFGIGLTAYFPISLLSDKLSTGFIGPLISALIAMQSVLLVIFIAPVVAGIAGLLNGYAGPSLRGPLVTSTLAAFIGFYVMVAFASGIIIGGFGGGGPLTVGTPNPSPVRTPTPTQTPVTPRETTPGFTIPPDYETESQFTVEVGIETPTYQPPSVDSGAVVRSLVLAGIPSGVVGGITAMIGYWLRKVTETDGFEFVGESD